MPRSVLTVLAHALYEVSLAARAYPVIQSLLRLFHILDMLSLGYPDKKPNMQFYSPVKQNAIHIAAVKKILSNPLTTIYNIVIFMNGGVPCSEGISCYPVASASFPHS